MLNLSFDDYCRTKIVEKDLIETLVILLKKPLNRGRVLKLMYHLSADFCHHLRFVLVLLQHFSACISLDFSAKRFNSAVSLHTKTMFHSKKLIYKRTNFVFDKNKYSTNSNNSSENMIR